MKGPYRLDEHHKFTPSDEPHWAKDWMKCGERYRVTKAFRDGDGDEHPVGEEWIFLGSDFSIYDNMRLLQVSLTLGQVWIFPLFTDRERQKALAESFYTYVQKVPKQEAPSGTVE